MAEDVSHNELNPLSGERVETNNFCRTRRRWNRFQPTGRWWKTRTLGPASMNDPHINMCFNARSAKHEAFFSWFSKEKQASHIGSCETCRAPFLFSLKVCVWFIIVIGHLGRPHSTHTSPMPALTGSVHAPILTKPSRAVFLQVVQSWSSQAWQRVFLEAWLGRV